MTPNTDEELDSDDLTNIFVKLDRWYRRINTGVHLGEELSHSDALEAIKSREERLVREAELRARLVELDLLEQAVNAGARNMNVYKTHRLKDLEKRLDALKEGE